MESVILDRRKNTGPIIMIGLQNHYSKTDETRFHSF
jgi:hypothetical protein